MVNISYTLILPCCTRPKLVGHLWPKPVVLFDRHRIRQDMQQNTHPQMARILVGDQAILAIRRPWQSYSFQVVENQLIEYCKIWFPKITSPATVCSDLVSLTARMWQARKVVRALPDCSMISIFSALKYLVLFSRLHKQTRQFSRQNRKQKLEEFLRENADLAMRHQMYD